MSDLSSKLKKIKQGVKQLAGQVKHLTEERNKLQEENVRIVLEIEELRKKLEDLEKKNLNLHLTGRFGEDEADGRASLKRRLNEYIQELDECITRLKGKVE